MLLFNTRARCRKFVITQQLWEIPIIDSASLETTQLYVMTRSPFHSIIQYLVRTFSETSLHVLAVTNGLPLVSRKRHVPSYSARGGPTFSWNVIREQSYIYVRTYVCEFNYPRLTGTYDVYGTTYPRAIVSRANLWDSGTSVVGPAVTIKVVKSSTNSLVTLIQCNVAR